MKGILGQTMREALRYEPSPLHSPEVDTDLPNMPAIERSGEVLRFQALRLEHGLSPSGILREWMKVVTRAAIILAVPTFLVVPVLTFLLSGLSRWTMFLQRSAMNLLLIFPVLLLLYLLAKLCIWLVIRRR